jgi:hypothetical protein
MFRNQPADPGQHPTKIELVQRAQARAGRQRHLDDHQPSPGPEHPGGLVQPGVEVGQVAQAPANHGAVEGGVGKVQLEGVGAHRGEPGRLDPSQPEHGGHEVGAHDPPGETLLPGERRAEVSVPAQRSR